MTQARFTRAAATLGCAAALFLGSANAQGLVVDATPCAHTIRVKADDVALGEVVARVAQALDARLEARVALPELVTFNGVGAPEDVLKRLMQGRNLVVETGPSSACKGRESVTRLWILPSGQETPRSTAGAATGAAVIQQPGDVQFGSLPERERGSRRRNAQPGEPWAAGRVPRPQEAPEPAQ